jgi:hypothetical protein
MRNKERALWRPEAFSRFCWKLRNEGDWVKKTAKAEEARSARERKEFWPVRASGRPAARARQRSRSESKRRACLRPVNAGTVLKVQVTMV